MVQEGPVSPQAPHVVPAPCLLGTEPGNSFSPEMACKTQLHWSTVALLEDDSAMHDQKGQAKDTLLSSRNLGSISISESKG